MNIKKESNSKTFLTIMKRILAIIIILISVSPIISFAATQEEADAFIKKHGGITNTITNTSINTVPALGIGGLFDLSESFLNRAVVLIISIAVVYFMYNVFQYTIAGNEEKKKTAKDGMVWGIVGIFIMVSIWGIVAILQQTFGTYGFNFGNTATDLKKSLPSF